jgi:hypothetical protein
MTFLNRMTRMKKLAAFVVYTPLIIGSLGIPFGASAFSIEQLSRESYGDFVVGPGKVEVALRPGETKTIPVVITNRMGETKVFTLETEDFTGSKDPEQTVLLLGQERGPYTLRDFIIPEERSFELENGQRATVNVTISVPEDAEPGGRYGSLLVGTATEQEQGTGGVAGGTAIVTRIGVLFFVTIPGDVVREGSLTSFDTIARQHFFFDTAPITFSLLYENTGSVHLNPYGTITITNLSGERVREFQIEPWFAMPGSVRRRDITWDTDFLIGRYVATAQINRGYGNVIDGSSIVLWVIPWKLVALVFGVLVVMIGLVRLIGSRFEIRRK